MRLEAMDAKMWRARTDVYVEPSFLHMAHQRPHDGAPRAQDPSNGAWKLIMAQSPTQSEIPLPTSAGPRHAQRRSASQLPGIEHISAVALWT